MHLPSFLVGFSILLLTGFAASAQSGEENHGGQQIIKGIVLPAVDGGGQWRMTSQSGDEHNTGYLSQSWEWEGGDSKSTGLVIRADFKRFVPPPDVSEVARAFGVAASRATYASTVSDRSLGEGQQWVEYSLPTQDEQGFKKIMAVSNGIVTLTLSRSLAGNTPEGWDPMVTALLNSSDSALENNAQKSQSETLSSTNSVR